MTTPTPAEQIRRFVEQHPGEWRAACLSPVYPCTGSECGDPGKVAVLYLPEDRRVRLIPHKDNVGIEIREYLAPWQILPCVDDGAPLLARITTRIADVLSVRGSPAEGLPPWLHDPVRRELRRRAGELLTLAGSSPTDVVSAAETLDEYLVSRGVVEVTGILPTLLEVGMSCRWAKGYDESPDDYIGLVSRRLAAVAGECETLRVTMKQAIAHLDAYDRSDGHEALAPLNARAVLRRALGVA